MWRVGLRDLPRRSHEHAACTFHSSHRSSSDCARIPVLRCVAVSQAHADTITLAWDPNAEHSCRLRRLCRDRSASTSVTRRRLHVDDSRGGAAVLLRRCRVQRGGEGPTSGQVCGYSNQFPVADQSRQPDVHRWSVGVTPVGRGSDPDGNRSPTAPPAFRQGCPSALAHRVRLGHADDGRMYSVTGRVPRRCAAIRRRRSSRGPCRRGAHCRHPAPSSDREPHICGLLTSPATNVSLGGTASDSVGVTSVSWANNRGGSGVASGTANWSVPSVGLQVGTQRDHGDRPGRGRKRGDGHADGDLFGPGYDRAGCDHQLARPLRPRWARRPRR